MNLQSDKIKGTCSLEKLFAYIDGELSSQEEMSLDLHLANCRDCTRELNSHKKVSTTLEILLEEEAKEIELPEDFTRVVKTKAESNVSGLRQPKERSLALFICAFLFFIITIGLGTEVQTVWTAIERFTDQFTAVIGFVFHLVYSVSVGITVILSSLSHKFIFSSAISLTFVVVFFVCTLLALSRMVFYYNRS